MLPIDFQLISTDAFIIAKLLHGSYDIKIDIYVTVTAGPSKTRNEQFLKLAVVRSREFSFDKNIFKKPLMLSIFSYRTQILTVLTLLRKWNRSYINNFLSPRRILHRQHLLSQTQKLWHAAMVPTIENGEELCILVCFTFFFTQNQIPQTIVRTCRAIFHI